MTQRIWSGTCIGLEVAHGVKAFTSFRADLPWVGRTIEAIHDACGQAQRVWLHLDAG